MFRLKIVFVVLISSAVINADEFNSDCNPRIGVVEVDDRYWAGTPWEIEIEPIIPYNCELVSEDKKNCVDEFRNITFEFQNGGFTAHCNFWYCYINGIYLPFATRSLIIRFSKEHVRATAYRYTYQMSNIPWFDMYSRTIPFKYNYDTTLFNIKYVSYEILINRLVNFFEET